MNKVVIAALVLAMLAGEPAGAEDASGDVEYYRQFAAKKLAAAEAETPKAASARPPVARAVPVVVYRGEDPVNVITAAPQYYHSRSAEDGHANGAGVSLLYQRRVNDWFSLGFGYRFAFMDSGGGGEDLRWRSHSVGIMPEFRLPGPGTLQLSLSQAFDRAGGQERGVAGVRDAGDYSADVTSFAAWWKKDFTLDCAGAWTLTPYAGWTSLYRRVKDANDWTAAPGVTYDDNHWQHLVSGGLGLSYRSGPLDVSVRGGVSHRAGRDNAPGYGFRAVAPDVTLFSHRAFLDRTVGSVGANISYAVNARARIGLGYEGMFGRDTSAHMGSIKFVVPF